MERVHDKVDSIANDVAQIKVYAQFIKESSDKIHEAVFGNGKPGALQRITQVWTKITVQWWLIAGSFSCIGIMVTVFISHLLKGH